MSLKTLLLTGRDVRSLMGPGDYLAAVESAFRYAALGRTESAPIVHVRGEGGTFHVKSAGMRAEKRYVAVKINGNFPENAARFGLPTIQGVIFLADGENGAPLALLDSIEITRGRTAGATALAARHLARPESAVVALCGCGAQSEVQIRALQHVLPLERVFAYDAEPERAKAFAERVTRTLGIETTAVSDVASARKSDVIVTCTTSRQPFLGNADVPEGAFVAAVGADAPEKRELLPDLWAGTKLVVDVLEQCAEIGELHHALEDGVLRREQVHAELVDVVSGAKSGRTDPAERIVFDSTGTAIQDVASAVVAYERAQERGMGHAAELSA